MALVSIAQHAPTACTAFDLLCTSPVIASLGVTVVVLPLLSLMQDQVRPLLQRKPHLLWQCKAMAVLRVLRNSCALQ